MSGKDTAPDEASSLVCYANEGDAAYMGFFGGEELSAFLEDLAASEDAIVEKIRLALPRIRDNTLHARLSEILAAKETNSRDVKSLLVKLTGT